MNRGKHLAGNSCPRPPCRGFTVLELLIAMLIAGILLGLAIPSYQRYVLRGQRAEAVRMLLAAAACQERIRAATGAYDTRRCISETGNGSYTLRIEPEDEAAVLVFTVFAEPRVALADDDCGVLSLDHAGTRRISGDEAALAACWSGK